MTTVKSDCGCCYQEFDREKAHELCPDCRRFGCRFKFNNGYGGKWIHKACGVKLPFGQSGVPDFCANPRPCAAHESQEGKATK